MDNEKRHAKENELKDLYRRLYELDKKFERNKGNRVLFAILGFSAVFFCLIFAYMRYMEHLTLKNLFFCFLISAILGTGHVIINSSVFGPMFYKSREENDILNSIRSRIKEIEKELNPDW